MNQLDPELFYRRHLPHYQPPGATLFATFRLAHSMPAEARLRLLAEASDVDRRLARITDAKLRVEQADQEDRRMFGKWDDALGAAAEGQQWLRDARVAEEVSRSLHYEDGRRYVLSAFCIMPNHVHVVCTPLLAEDGTYHTLASILQSIKGFSAIRANRVLGRKGTFWQHESYDHVVRDEAELHRIVEYVLSNPVKASLVKQWQDWQWSFYRAAV